MKNNLKNDIFKKCQITVHIEYCVHNEKNHRIITSFSQSFENDLFEASENKYNKLITDIDSFILLQ